MPYKLIHSINKPLRYETHYYTQQTWINKMDENLCNTKHTHIPHVFSNTKIVSR